MRWAESGELSCVKARPGGVIREPEAGDPSWHFPRIYGEVPTPEPLLARVMLVSEIARGESIRRRASVISRTPPGRCAGDSLSAGRWEAPLRKGACNSIRRSAQTGAAVER